MILNIIDEIYSNSHFTTVLIGAIIFLIVLFVIVLIMGVKDAKKAKEPVELKKDEKDITFEELTEEQKDVAEEVTFEMPTISENLEEFKKGLEEELKNTPGIAETITNVENVETPPVEEAGNPFEPVDENATDVVEDDFLNLIDMEKKQELKKHEDLIPMSLDEVDLYKARMAAKEEVKGKGNDNTMEIELPMKHEKKEERVPHQEVINSEERRKRERMLDDYLTQTQALSLDAINEKLKEFDDDNF